MKVVVDGEQEASSYLVFFAGKREVEAPWRDIYYESFAFALQLKPLFSKMSTFLGLSQPINEKNSKSPNLEGGDFLLTATIS